MYVGTASSSTLMFRLSTWDSGLMHVRPGDPDDVEDVGRLHALSRRAAYAHLVDADALRLLTTESQAGFWQDRLRADPPPNALFVVETTRGVEGFTYGSARGQQATLHAIHVLPDMLGSGAGQLLHDRLLEQFTHWGCTQAELSVLSGNDRAQAFYRRNGWLPDGRGAEHAIGGVTVPVVGFRRALP